MHLLSNLEETTLICRREERTRIDIQDLCTDILGNFDRASRAADFDSTDPAGSGISAYYNLGALAHVNAGNLERAEHLSRASVALWKALANRTGRMGWLIHALQPYINLGRLAAMRGDTNAAVQVFRDVFLFVHSDQNLNLCSLLIPNEDRDKVLDSDRTINDVIIQVYLRDSIRALLNARDYEGVLKFLDHVEAHPKYQGKSGPIPAVLEARARALRGIGNYQEALYLLRDLGNLLVRTSQPYLICHALTADVYRRAGNLGQAAKILNTVSSYYPQIQGINAPPSALRQFRYLLALAFLSIEDIPHAYEAAQEAFRLSDEMADQAGRLRCLALMAELSLAPDCPDGAAAYRDRMQEEASSTLYAIEKAICLYQQSALASRDNDADGARRLLGQSLHITDGIDSLEAAGASQWIRDHSPEAVTPVGNPDRLSTSAKLAEVYRRLTEFAVAQGAAQPM